MIEAMAPSMNAEWDAYVDRHPLSTCYHLSGWGVVAERAYGLRARLLISRAGPGLPVRGGLPLFVVPRPFHRYVTTGIFGAYGPILADDAAAAEELVHEARRFTDRERAKYLHIKALDGGPVPSGMTPRHVWSTAMLSLAGGQERVWKGFKSSIRAAVRQALRAGITLRSGHGELDAFYDVLAENMHRKGSPIYGRRLMREILGALVTAWTS
jgi:hypothetical protein